VTFTAPAPHRYAGPPAVPGYVLDEFLGRGSMGVVWAATHLESGERIALKVLEPGGPSVDVDLDAVDREEQLGQRVSGAHLLAVRGRVGMEDGRVALVMTLADGGSLRDVVTIRGALPLGEVVTALTPLATTVAELHDAGVVHADVAPGNVLFTPQGRPMLADLSSAWLVDDGWPEQSRGTPGFAAPEVLVGRPPVPGSDVWSLGALAWYARTGGLTPPEWVTDLHWSRALPVVASGGVDDDGFERGSVADVVAAVGPELAPLLVRMLADDPDARPSGAEVALALYRAAAPEPVRLVGHHPDPAAAVTTRIRRDAAETRSRSQLRDDERSERRRARRERRRARLRGWLSLRAREAGSSGGGAGPEAASGRGMRSGWRARLAMLALMGAVLAGGMLALLRLTGGPLEVVTASVTTADSSLAAATPSSPSPTSPSGSASATPNTTPSSAASTDAAAAAPADAVARDPVGALQRLADRRAAALVAADPVLLASAEQAGSIAFANDLRTVNRLRDQGQRYADLAFTVRSAEAVSVAPTTVALRATVDRSAYQVTSSGGAAQSVGPAAGSPLRYTLTWTDGGWRLTEVGPS
jgi:hypothetical protein